MNHILILGAGLMQEPAIKSAHELGFSVTVFDGNPDAYCKDMCEVFEVIDLIRTEDLVQRAKELHNVQSFSAVFTAGTDFSFAVSSVASALQLPAHTVQASINASDKIIMRSCFEKAGVPSPKFLEIAKDTSSDTINTFVASTTYPIVVKPCDNMGGRGCRLVRTKDELDEAVRTAIQYSKSSRAILEEYMEGPEFSIDALVFNNEVTITGFADRHIFFPPYFIEMGHSIPTDIDSKKYNELIKTFVKGINALGLTHGAAKADIKYTKNGPMVGEIAARLSGGYMSGWTFPYASKLNLTKQALCIALNIPPKELQTKRTVLFSNFEDFNFVYDYPCEQHCVERAWLSIPGTVDTVTLASKVNLQNVFPRLLEGATAVFPENNVQKGGNVICCKSTRKEAEMHAQSFIRNTFMRLTKNDKNTISFLNMPLDTDFPPSAYTLPIECYSIITTMPKQAINAELSLPECLHEHADLLDWNGRSLQDTINIVNEYIKENKEKIQSDFTNELFPNFWHCVVRGGLQGALFYFL